MIVVVVRLAVLVRVQRIEAEKVILERVLFVRLDLFERR